MRRHLAAVILLLWTQVFAIVAPGTTVYCVHDDGHVAIELAGSECCRAAHEEERRLPCDADDARGPRLDAPADRCRDVPVQHAQTSIARAPARVESVASERAAPVALFVDASPTRPLAATSARPAARGSPPDVVPRPARSFFPRC